MANKIEIEKLDSLSANDAAAVLAINNNFTTIQEAINNTLSRDGTVPNFMDADIDLNTHRIINGGEPVEDLDYVTLKFFKENVGESAANAAAAELSAQRAASSAQSANISAQNAFNSAQMAAGIVGTFDEHVADKIQEFDDNAVAKTQEFNQNAAEKQAQVDASVDTAASSAQESALSAGQSLQYANEAKEAAEYASFGNIGDIKYTTRTDVPNGGIWCDGTEYTQTQFPDVYQMLVDGKISSTSYTTFDSTVSANGSCGTFGLNTATTSFKVPLLKDVYVKVGDTPLMFGAESLPNIKGSFGGVNGALDPTGAFYNDTTKNNAYRPATAASDINYLGLDASRSSSTYQDGAKVNPDHVVYRAYVVVYSKVLDVPASVDKALIWAEGTDAQVQALGGIHSSKGWAEANENLNYTDITNCITKIPQDIKVELSNGTLTLKAGSKVYIPNGVGVFDEYIVQSDISITDNIQRTMVLFVNNSGTNLYYNITDTYSGDAQPSIGRFAVWYDTANNIIKSTANSGASWEDGWSLPICIMTSASTNGFTSIDQVFNGFGYIGGQPFSLGGLSGLVPNGKTDIGKNVNLNTNTDSVLLSITVPTAGNYELYITKDNSLFLTGTIKYDITRNINYDIISGTQVNGFKVADLTTDSSGRIISFNPKTVFQAVDRNELSTYGDIIDQGDNYTKFKTNMLMCWDDIVGANTSKPVYYTIVFPKPFANTKWALSFIPTDQTAHATSEGWSIVKGSIKTTGCQIITNSYPQPTAKYFVIGQGA